MGLVSPLPLERDGRGYLFLIMNYYTEYIKLSTQDFASDPKKEL